MNGKRASSAGEEIGGSALALLRRCGGAVRGNGSRRERRGVARSNKNQAEDQNSSARKTLEVAEALAIRLIFCFILFFFQRIRTEY